MKQILFNTEMVRALLEGRKTVTRRVVKPQPEGRPVPMKTDSCWPGYFAIQGTARVVRPPYQPGDALWARETFRVDYLSNIVGSGRVQYKADGSYADIHFSADRYDMMRRAQRKPGWRPNENMPREVARIFLLVTGVRVERLQAITEQDAKDEGACKAYPYTDPETGKTTYMQDENATYIGGFVCAWDNTIKSADRATCGWEANPWVWVIEFERISKEEAINGA